MAVGIATIAVLLLWKVVVKLTRDYDRQLDEGKSPEFLISQYPELGHGVDHEIWRERHKPGA